MNYYFDEEIETLSRDDIDNLVDERVRYTVKYAYKNSPFYRKWFDNSGIKYSDIHDHGDLRDLPIISGDVVRNKQPPKVDKFEFKSTEWDDVFTIHETSGTSGIPKSFFLTWDDWQRYAEKYARAFVSQNFNSGDRVVVCASYGMNVGANTMTLAAHEIGMAIIPEGKCTFPVRIMENYKPTSIVASVFKLLRLARRMESDGVNPSESSIKRLVAGGESFSEESRSYLEEIWDVPVYNTYGSTEGTMCGECVKKSGLHVPEDLVHMDIYNPQLEDFVKDGECGRIVLTTLLPVGGKTGNLLINYDTDDTTVVITRDKCKCGRTHMRIMNPQRESETLWVGGIPFNKINIEQGIFQRDNMDYITGEYEAFLYNDNNASTLKIRMESLDLEDMPKDMVEENVIKTFYKFNPYMQQAHADGTFDMIFEFTEQEGLELYHTNGRPKRLIDRR